MAKQVLRPEDPKINQFVAMVFDRAADLDRGDLIPFEWIEKIIGAERPTKPWGTVVKKLKRRFERERGITLWAVVNCGFRLCTAQEQMTMCAEKRSKRALRQLAKGIGHMEAIPTGELSTQQQTTRAAKIEGQKRALRGVKRARRQDAAMNKATQGLPRRKSGEN